MISKWGKTAYLAMERAFALSKGQTQKEIMKDVDACYPFGERAMHPYKMWLKVRKAFIREKWGDGRKAELYFKPEPRAADKRQAEIEFIQAKSEGLFK